MKKSALLIAALVACSFMLFACGGGSASGGGVKADDKAKLLVGKWKNDLGFANNYMQYEFKKDGTWNWKTVSTMMKVPPMGGTYTFDGTMLSCVVKGENRTDKFQIKELTAKKMVMYRVGNPKMKKDQLEKIWTRM